jgi:uncharacterized protein (DUF2062 family)
VSTAGGFWRQRVFGTVLAQLRQGITPQKIALTIALGCVLAVFPIVGSTSLLCAVVAVWLRLNQPIIQLVNWLCYPLQFVLLIPFYRAGEWFGAPHLTLSIPQLIQRFEAGPMQFVADFGIVALGGIAVWLLTAPVAGVLIYLSAYLPLRSLSARAAGSAQ